MKTYKIVPYQSVGQLIFGMERQEVRYLCGSFKNYPTGFPVENHSVDDFGYQHCYYTPDRKLEAVSVFPEVTLQYHDQSIIVSEDIQFLLNQLNKIVDDLKYLEFDESYYSQTLGLMIYSPEDLVENVLIFSEHYYDEENEYLMKHFGVTKFE